MAKLKDLTGLKFGKLLVVKRHEKNSPLNQVVWECICDCGNFSKAISINLLSGARVSCGCARTRGNQLKIKPPKHGHCSNYKHSREYQTWGGMKSRCYNKNDRNYHNYGGRGIVVCDRWRNSFQNFFDDMGEKPVGYSIERMDVNGNYEPSNCKWVPFNKQQRNARKSIRYNGENLADLCEQMGLDYNLMLWRISGLGWSFEKAVNTPKFTKSESAQKANFVRWGYEPQ